MNGFEQKDTKHLIVIWSTLYSVDYYLQIYLNFEGQHLACLYMKRVRVIFNSLRGGSGTICQFKCLHVAAKNVY
jgi:hypothetical protein